MLTLILYSYREVSVHLIGCPFPLTELHSRRLEIIILSFQYLLAGDARVVALTGHVLKCDNASKDIKEAVAASAANKASAATIGGKSSSHKKRPLEEGSLQPHVAPPRADFANACLLRFLVTSGIDLSAVDSPFFQEFVGALQPSYKTPGGNLAESWGLSPWLCVSFCSTSSWSTVTWYTCLQILICWRCFGVAGSKRLSSDVLAIEHSRVQMEVQRRIESDQDLTIALEVLSTARDQFAIGCNVLFRDGTVEVLEVKDLSEEPQTAEYVAGTS